VSEQFRRPLPHDFHPPVASFTVVSDDVSEGRPLKADQVKDGGDTSPHLRWEGYPAGTKSFAVTCFDPEAPTGSGFWHWSVFDIPADVTELPAGAASGDMKGLPAGAVHVRNDNGTRDYVGAFPPPGDGPHRYVFTVYAVGEEKLEVPPEASPAVVGFQLRFKAVGRAQLIGLHETPAED
jgi:Raf kinase inhibitor-like YbhB/YbcL family protein